VRIGAAPESGPDLVAMIDAACPVHAVLVFPDAPRARALALRVEAEIQSAPTQDERERIQRHAAFWWGRAWPAAPALRQALGLM
jgi:hypothetical protein